VPVSDELACQDGIMLVTPRPGVNRENLLKSLQSVYSAVYNLRGGGGAAQDAYERLLAYIEWTSAAIRMLGNQVSNSDLDRLVLTERYRLLLAGVAGTMTSKERPVQRVLNGLVSLELDERVEDFDAAIKALQGQIARWSGYGHYVVPDTSFYIHHKDKLEDVDFGPLINVWQSEVTVLVPIVIVDELDRLKESKDNRIRWRAGYTLAVLERLFADGTRRARLRPGNVAPGPDSLTRSEVTIELVFDSPGHVRLPDNDDEIIDRALAIEPLADRKVTLLTYDTGQSMRARNAGLQVVKLSKDTGEEPK
jgi:rRNA-processing protein FCF1